MINYNKTTDIFCIIDEFCQEFKQSTENSSLERNPRDPLQWAAVRSSAYSCFFHVGGFRCLKHFYLFYV